MAEKEAEKKTTLDYTHATVLSFANMFQPVIATNLFSILSIFNQSMSSIIYVALTNPLYFTPLISDSQIFSVGGKGVKT